MDSNTMLLMFIPLAVVMVFFTSRSNKRRQNLRAEQLNSVRIGQTITTIGGFYGEVQEVGSDFFVIRLLPGEALAKITKEALRLVISGSDEDGESYDDEEDEIIIEVDGESISDDENV